MTHISSLADVFKERFGHSPAAAGSAPGRVEVLGNHTDYNDGFILAAAIDRRIHAIGRPISGQTARLWSVDYNEGWEFPVTAPVRVEQPFWANYAMGVVSELNALGCAPGAFEAVLGGDVPVGAGLSSSAAIQVAMAAFLRQIFSFSLDGLPLAMLAKKAENNFVGVQCGLLDPYTSVMGQAGRLVFLDCRQPEQGGVIPMGEGVALVLADSMARHQLADGAYNRLRESCFKAARIFAERMPSRNITHLRDVTWDDFVRHMDQLPETELQRARHVISENNRVLRGKEALLAGDVPQMGVFMSASHASSRDDFGNSCRELDILVETALPLAGCHGARLSGGGFGGCAVCLVATDRLRDFTRELTEKYSARTGLTAAIHIIRPDDGARSTSL